MGISRATTEFLIDSAQRGVRFDKTLTIGRQHLAVGPWKLARMLARAGMPPQDPQALDRELPWFAEPLFSSLGARELASLDISGHEGAAILWDLNDPVPDEYHERFDVVFDGGSLEHIFHAPAALESYMRMTRVGGHVIIATTGNNYFGHGLYQFGPDFFYATLNEANGFVVERLLAVAQDMDAPARLLGTTIVVEPRPRIYEVVDPSEVGGRVELVNCQPVMLMLRARRVERRAVFATTPQQTDYLARWRDFDARGDEVAHARRGRPAALAKRVLGPRTQLHLMFDILPALAALIDPGRTRRERWRRSFRNAEHFRRVRRW